MEPETDTVDATFRNYALKYFEIHARQRLITFRFFVTFATAIGAAMAYSLRIEEAGLWPARLGFLLCFLAIVFWMLDYRTRNLVKNGENALKHLDERCGLKKADDGAPHVLALFSRDDNTREKNRTWRKLFLGYISYRVCFELVFVLVFAIGLLSITTHCCGDVCYGIFA